MLQSIAYAQPQPIPLTPARSRAAAPAARAASACSSCSLRSVCLPQDLDGGDLDRFGQVASQKRRIARGAALYRSGDVFDTLYAVRSGAFKSVGVSLHGDEKVTGFHLPGEILGLDAINGGRHDYDAVALEDSEVCVIPYAPLEQLALTVPPLQRHLFKALSGDISRDHGLMLLLGGMTAEQRLAAFLLSLSRRYRRLGFSASSFVLRMTREEIGSYLGLTLETVSRLLSRFQHEGLIAVQQRDVEFRNAGRLMEMVGHW